MTGAGWASHQRLKRVRWRRRLSGEVMSSDDRGVESREKHRRARKTPRRPCITQRHRMHAWASVVAALVVRVDARIRAVRTRVLVAVAVRACVTISCASHTHTRAHHATCGERAPGTNTQPTCVRPNQTTPGQAGAPRHTAEHSRHRNKSTHTARLARTVGTQCLRQYTHRCHRRRHTCGRCADTSLSSRCSPSMCNSQLRGADNMRN